MKKYLAVAQTSMKSVLASKSSIFVLLAQALIPTVVMAYLWTSILPGHSAIQGMTAETMIKYYIGVNVVNFFVWYAIDWELNDDIHSGELSNIARRPVNMMGYYFSRMLGDRIANLMVLAPIILIILVMHIKNIFPIDVIWFGQVVMTILLAMLLWFAFGYVIGCLAYWFENLFFVLIVKEIVVSFLAGYYLPLNLFPETLKNLSNLLPFQYFSYFPIQTLLKQTLPINWSSGILIGLMWLIALYGIGYWLNRLGARHYSDVMG